MGCVELVTLSFIQVRTTPASGVVNNVRLSTGIELVDVKITICLEISLIVPSRSTSHVPGILVSFFIQPVVCAHVIS